MGEYVEINELMMQEFPGEERLYRSADKLLNNEDSHAYPVEFLNSLTLSGMPPHKLILKLEREMPYHAA